VSILSVVGAISLWIAPAVSADDRGTATAVLTSQLALLERQNALSKCLAASPTKNTPCTKRNSLSLAKVADREIKLINSAMDGSESDCVRTVARQQLSYLRLWRDGALALHRNERKKAKSLFVKSLEIAAAQDQVQPDCFAKILAGAGP
jgi:hypothetical protein